MSAMEDERVSWLAKWLEHALRAERQALGLELERRHGLLLKEYLLNQSGMLELPTRTPFDIDRVDKDPITPQMTPGTARSGDEDDPKAKEIQEFISEEPRRQKSPSSGNEEKSASAGSEAAFASAQSSTVEAGGAARDSSGPVSSHSDNHASSRQKAQVGTVFEEDNHLDFPLVKRLVSSSKFEVVFAFLIVMNTVVMAMESQYHGLSLGKKLQYPRYTSTKEEAWPGMGVAFVVLDYIFGVIFTVEIFMKVIGLKLAFLHDWWNWFDSVIVFGWLIDALGRDLVTLPLDPMMLRLARLARLLRLLRLAKSLKGFDPLFLMVTTLKGSLAVTVWAFMLLFICQTMFALLLNQVLVSYYLEVTNDSEAMKKEVFEYFGTFSRAMLSMFEITLGNWVPVARLLADGVNEWFMIFSLLHKVSMGFAVIGVINGIFIQETFKVAACDDTLMLLQEERAEEMLHKKMAHLFIAADQSDDGGVDQVEFKAIMEKPQVRMWLAAQDLDVTNAETLFELLDKQGGSEVTAINFVKGVSRLKGSARAVDMAMLMRMHQSMLQELTRIRCQVSDITDQVGQTGSNDRFNLQQPSWQARWPREVQKPKREDSTYSLLPIPKERSDLRQHDLLKRIELDDVSVAIVGGERMETLSGVM